MAPINSLICSTKHNLISAKQIYNNRINEPPVPIFRSGVFVGEADKNAISNPSRRVAGLGLSNAKGFIKRK